MNNLFRNIICTAVVLAFSGAAFAAQPDADRVILKFKPGSRANVESAVVAAGGRVHLQISGMDAMAASVPATALNGLRNNPNIEYVEQDPARYPMAQSVPYGVPMVQADEAVKVKADGSGIKVCVIDSGIKQNHEDFAGVLMSGYASSGQTWSSDFCGHGTHVAGTIAAANNSLGVLGVSPGKVSLHIIKVFDGTSCGWSYSSTLIDAANRCANAGAKVINMSLGGGQSSTTESNGFANLYSQGVLSIAAAGNAGNTTKSYPASYNSVVSVAAVDSTGALASFSQRNNQVEIAAPGVGVLSTYPVSDGAVSVGSNAYIASALEGSPASIISAAWVSGDQCTSSGAFNDKVVLCERGGISFADKVLNAQSGGAVGVIIYNNVSGGFSGTLNGTATSIPSVSISREDGQQILASGSSGPTATVDARITTDANGYAYLDGTSMATPHVAGVAALVWSAKPTATNQEVRNAMNSTAIDLGTAGRDNSFGYGLVQAADAVEALLDLGSVEPPPVADPPSNLTGTKSRKGKNYTYRLNWSGGASTVDVYRGTTKVASAISNSSTWSHTVRDISGTYQVCNAGSTTACSNILTL